MAFVDKLGSEPGADVRVERDRLVERIGPEAAERAAGVAATFQMMNRLLDGVGAPVRGRTQLAPIATALGFRLDDLDH